MEVASKQVVLITGINGFTGLYLEKFFLNKGFKVYGTTKTKTNNKNHFVCNITNKEDIKKVFNNIQTPNYIIHTAAISFVAGDDQANMYNVNVFGTLNLLDVVIENKINPTKILIVSSAAVYGNIAETLSEDMCPSPVNHYGNSKLVMENMTKAYFSCLNIIITRPFNYTGLGQSSNFLVPKIVSHFKSKAPVIELGNIDVYREFNDVDYVVSCYEKLLFSNVKSDIINVCSGHALNIRRIIDIMETYAGYKIKVKVNPKFVRKNEIEILKGFTNKLITVIGDFSSEYGIEYTLKKMYNN